MEQIILGVWIWTASCWHSTRMNPVYCWVSMVVASAVSIAHVMG